MATESCCSQPKAEQLYMLELLVDRLNIVPEKLQGLGSKPLVVKLEFLDFPAFEISEEEFRSSKKQNDKQANLSNERKSRDGALDFSAGKSCLFPKRPNELVDEMRSKPLKIGVYVAHEKIPCSKEETDAAVCKSEIPLPGCLCDQVCMSMNDAAHLPKPYTVRNTWNLIDDEGKPAGTILLFLRLTCLGKSIVTQFAVRNEAFLFKSSNSSNEFQCRRIPAENETGKDERLDESRGKICMPEEQREPEVNRSPKPGSVIGLVSICQELAERDGGPLEVVPSVKLSPCRSVKEQLLPMYDTSKENFVDSNCISSKGGIFNRKITGVFGGGEHFYAIPSTVSSNTRSFDGAYHGDATSWSLNAETRCANSVNYLYRPRMRGGGPWNEVKFDNVVVCEGTKNYRANYREPETKRYPIQSIDNLIHGSCKSPSKMASSRKSGCGCYGKLGTGAMGTFKSTALSKEFGCSNEPCQGIDCLIRAFKETEDFVESIGKVRGLAGLGLMDPTESPYFGREKDDARTSCDPKMPVATSPNRILSNSRQLRRRLSGKLDAAHAVAIVPPPAVISSPYRDQPVNQTEPTSQIARSRKKTDEKSDKQRELQQSSMNPTSDTEASPCGEPSCKSKKKKKESTEEDDDGNLTLPKIEEPTKKLSIARKSVSTRKTKQRPKIKSLTLPGPAGDRPSSRRNSYVKVSKRIMRLVNTYGSTRFCYGHKNCLDVRLRVPGNMGWLWNTGEAPGRLRTPIGWKPGAISKFVWERLQQAKQSMLLEPTSSTSEIRAAGPTTKSRKHRAMRNKNFHTLGRGQWMKNRSQGQDEDEIELPPTLHIHRKDGTYYVTMYPVKPEGIGNEADENTKPLQFKITKNRENDDVTSSSTGSDMEIEFSPPAALTRYKKKDPVKHRNTQVNQQDILDTLKVNVDSRQGTTRKSRIKK